LKALTTQKGGIVRIERQPCASGAVLKPHSVAGIYATSAARVVFEDLHLQSPDQ